MASMSVKRPHIQTHVKDFVSFWAWFLEIFFLFFVFAPGRKVYPFCLLICETGFWGKIFQMLNSALTLGLNFVAIGLKISRASLKWPKWSSNGSFKFKPKWQTSDVSLAWLFETFFVFVFFGGSAHDRPEFGSGDCNWWGWVFGPPISSR